jgi:hypothetical protein
MPVQKMSQSEVHFIAHISQFLFVRSVGMLIGRSSPIQCVGKISRLLQPCGHRLQSLLDDLCGDRRFGGKLRFVGHEDAG